MELHSTEAAILTLDLVQRARSGDTDAFADLVARYHRRVIGYVTNLVRDRDLAEEVAQEVFLVAYQSLATFDARSKFLTWLIGIARNRAISVLRSEISRQKREARVGKEMLLEWQLEHLERTGRSEEKQLIENLKDCIEELQPEHQELLQRHYFNNETLEFIAGDLRRKPSSMRMALLRLRKSLGKCIQQRMNADF